MTNKVIVEFVEVSPLGEVEEKPIMAYEAPFYPSYHEGETITLEKEDGFIEDEEDDDKAHHYTIVDIHHSVRQQIRSEYSVKSQVKMKVFLRRS